jgi:hypothetical protein
MRISIVTRAVLGIAALLAAGAVLHAAEAQYVGAAKCKTCHAKEFTIWSESLHAKAFDKLSAEDRTKPECVACHVTGHGKPAAQGAALEGVQCENCHGAGSLYKAVSIMSKKAYEADPEGMHKKSLEAGLVVPTEATCKGCHNEKSPHFKGFDFKTMSEKIKHW